MSNKASTDNTSKGCSISSDTFKRLYLLNIIAAFDRGSYGLKRLHKVTYIAERQDEKIRPFEFKKYHQGQYSETLDIIKDQLMSGGLVGALPLDTARVIRLQLPDDTSFDMIMGGNKYVIPDRVITDFYQDSFKRISPTSQATIKQTVQEYGYLPEDELVKRCYDFPEFVNTEFDSIIFESTLPDRIETPTLTPDECEELELSLNPIFISAMVNIVDGMDKSKLDLSRIEIIGTPI